MKSSPFFRIFPPPKFLEMPYAGIDISDLSVHCLMYRHTRHGLELDRFASKALPKGAIESGEIRDEKAVIEVVRALASELKITYVKASLPEERMYLFKTEVPLGTAAEIHENIALRLEENVPLPASEAVFYFDLVRESGSKNHRTASVSVAPRKLVESYLSVLAGAGLVTVSFEVVPKSLARAIVPVADQGTKLIIHLMEAKAGFYIVDEGLVLFTSTMPWIVREGNLDPDDVEPIRAELYKVSAYWEEHGHEGGDVSEVMVCGRNAREITAVLGRGERAMPRLSVANVWTNAFPFERYIPAISRTESLEYAVVAGLAMPSRI